MGIPEWMRSALAQTPPLASGLVVIWLLVMILVPILKWIWGERAQLRGIVISVLLQAAAVLAILWPVWGSARTLRTGVVILVIGWAVEALGSHTGFPFGSYEYTDRLRPQIWRVPVLIPFAWLMMLPPAWAVATAITGSAGRVVFAAVSALAFTTWDLFLDPQMVAWGLWTWTEEKATASSGSIGDYFGIPWVNFAGWFAISFLLTWVLMPEGKLTDTAMLPLIVVYGLTLFLESFGQLVFWRLRGPAFAGTLGMGSCLLLAVLRLGEGL